MMKKGYAAGGKAMMKKGYAAGGAMPMVMKDGKKVPAFAADGEGKMKHGGKVKKAAPKKMMGGGMMAKMKSGGGVSKRADGVATKGKTKGKMI